MKKKLRKLIYFILPCIRLFLNLFFKRKYLA
ncbi:acyltransferase, partial [Acinetobacter baumannii]|nr:acyltransferase [Acinetobacter baumannii]